MVVRRWLAPLALALLAAGAVRAEPLPAAVFPLEMNNTSPQGTSAAEEARLRALDAQLRELLARSGRYAPVPLPPAVAEQARGRELRECNGCDAPLAREAGAAVSVTGWVQKVSDLILNINLVIRDAASGRVLRAGSVDIRGNTDESWSRGMSYLMRNIILRPENAAQ